MYDKVVAKINNIDTSGFILKTQYNTDKSELEINILDTSVLVKKTNCIAKVTELENDIPSINDLATNSVLTAVENEIPVSNLVKKQQFMTKNLVKLKRNSLVMIMINMLLLQNFKSLEQKLLLQDQNKQLQ